ncbi:hypothetical protein C2G38_2219714 [Gigaspora rosea]|uniref:Uncharacterized protein n=1 Tax=Gigaspora rosea TaxID=44941 RepID=A0A397U6S9_9GLOM|nr:hypothetical protein C2G38_2219714 [Gigaspora rosea]
MSRDKVAKDYILVIEYVSEGSVCQNLQTIAQMNLWKDIRKRIVDPSRQYQHAAEIISWIDGKKKTIAYSIRNNPYELRLLLCGSRDGFTADIFWDLCDKKENALHDSARKIINLRFEIGFLSDHERKSALPSHNYFEIQEIGHEKLYPAWFFDMSEGNGYRSPFIEYTKENKEFKENVIRVPGYR